ncbi:hypothetical protein ACQ4PT_035539 [Festuca glaucescens]
MLSCARRPAISPAAAAPPSAAATRSPASLSATPSRAASAAVTGEMVPQNAAQAASSRKQSANSLPDPDSVQERVDPSSLSKASPGRIGYAKMIRWWGWPSGPEYMMMEWPCGRSTLTAVYAAPRLHHSPSPSPRCRSWAG